MTREDFENLKPGDIVRLKSDIDTSINQKYLDWEVLCVYGFNCQYIMAQNDYCNPQLLYFNELV